MSQIEKLQNLQKRKQNNLSHFSGLVVVNVGVEPKKHYPKLKDSSGNRIKDEKGVDKRSETSDGWTYTFVEFGTAKTVKIVLPKLIDINLLTVYQVAGYGYDIRSAGMIFIEQDSRIGIY